jgi:hypothetical protein
MNIPLFPFSSSLWMASPFKLNSTLNWKSKVKVTLPLTVSQSVSLGVEPRLGLMTRYLLLFDSCCFVFGAPSLTRGRVWLLYMQLILVSVVFLWSESLRTRDHILLSQIWDFSFRRLLRLKGSRWRYTTPPPHGCNSQLILFLAYNISERTTKKHPISIVVVQLSHF